MPKPYRPNVTETSRRHDANTPSICVYKGSTNTFTIKSVRTIAPDSVLVIAPSRVDMPMGLHVSAVASVLLVRDGNRWKVADFHNTKREGP